MNATAETAATKELRLALVLYGGVSLAIYMHGITKELHKLVLASSTPGTDDGRNPFESGTERVYWDALKHLQDRTGVQTRVVIDVIAGASAGGINGIYLAKALAQNLNQDELSKLWIEKGDIANLLRGRTIGGGKARLVLPFLGALLRSKQNAPILRGDVMVGWYVEALEAMDGTRPEPGKGPQSLMPEDHDLALFVTVTDFNGYKRQIPIEDPRVVTDLRHRHVFEFCRPGEGGPNQFEPTFNHALAFAARSTSSFPGAFPAINFADFEAARRPPVSLGDFAHDFCRVYELSDASAEDTYFVDGGLLDNYPFDHAIHAVRRRSASGEVERRLLYVQPDPRGKAVKEGAPSWPATALGGFATIPAQQPILDQLLDVAKLNDRVTTIRQIIESSFGHVRAKVEKLPGSEKLDALLDTADAKALQAVRDAATDEANREIGPGYTTYVRTKIRAVVDDFAALVNRLCDYPDESNHAFFVRAVVSAWAEEGKLFERKKPTVTPEQIEFLRQFDLDYTRRLLQFLIAAVSWWYEDDVGHDATPPTRAQLDRAKALLSDRLETIEKLMSGESFEEPTKARLRALFSENGIKAALSDDGLDPGPFLAGAKDELQRVRAEIAGFLAAKLQTFSSDLTEALCKETKEWSSDARVAFFVRYLGFAFWDVLLFPVQFLAAAGERDSVDVLRVSPLDSRLLHPPGPKDTPKLKGLGLAHFAAFLDRGYRENDYLWGRLDGAERLLVLLLGQSDLECAGRCVDAFAAILAQEAEPLGTTEDLVASLRPQLEAIRALAQTADEALSGQTPNLRPREDFAPELNRVIGEAVASGKTAADAQRRLQELLVRVLADTKEESPRRRFAKAGVPRPVT
jgi:patatin-related protein